MPPAYEGKTGAFSPEALPHASRRVANDDPELLELLTGVLALGDDATRGIDLVDGGAALAIAILLNHDQPVLYLSGQAIHHAPEDYCGEGKTD
ncbi:IS110 family transposase [Streptomyces mirabilis]|uniref:IS110 family transposase n=1 Tax=Streptomyces mirabilis TaxID=68239 RepID=UPI00369AFA8D